MVPLSYFGLAGCVQAHGCPFEMVRRLELTIWGYVCLCDHFEVPVVPELAPEALELVSSELKCKWCYKLFLVWVLTFTLPLLIKWMRDCVFGISNICFI